MNQFITNLSALQALINSSCNKNEIKVINYLLSFPEGYDTLCPKQNKIAIRLGLVRESICRIIKRLVSKGLVQKKYRFYTTCIYTVNPLIKKYKKRFQSVFSSLRKAVKVDRFSFLSAIVTQIYRCNNYISLRYRNFQEKEMFGYKSKPKLDGLPPKCRQLNRPKNIGWWKKEKKVENEEVGYYKRQQIAQNKLNSMSEEEKKYRCKIAAAKVNNVYEQHYAESKFKHNKREPHPMFAKYCV